MLSGPAAGIAGALFHENVTDGIFIEVGGTSADCSVIRRGRPQMRPARIGGHRTLLRTLDVRTLGVAGGSLAHVARGRGRRRSGRARRTSPAIATRRFAIAATIAAARVALDGRHRRAAPTATGRIAITPTCAANALGLRPDGSAFARGDAEAARLACERVGAALGSGRRCAGAGDPRTRDGDAARATIDELIADYELDRATVVLVGGGGGAAALIPFAARALGFEHRIARDAEVISPLGVALALVRDVVERTIVDPTPDDLVRIRREAIDAAIRAGAAPDARRGRRRRSIARAIASARRPPARPRSSKAPPTCAGRATTSAATPRARALRADRPRSRWSRGRRRFSLLAAGRALAVVDERAVVRLIAPRAAVVAMSGRARSTRALAAAIDEHTTYGDVGRALPDLWLLAGARIVELTGLRDSEGAVALAADEVAGLPADAAVAIVALAKRA